MQVTFKSKRIAVILLLEVGTATRERGGVSDYIQGMRQHKKEYVDVCVYINGPEAMGSGWMEKAPCTGRERMRANEGRHRGIFRVPATACGQLAISYVQRAGFIAPLHRQGEAPVWHACVACQRLPIAITDYENKQ